MAYSMWAIWSAIILTAQAQLPTIDFRQPFNGLSYSVKLTGYSYSSYPGQWVAPHLNFAVPGGIVVGSANRLSLLNEDLSLQQSILLNTSNSSSVASCLANQSSTDASSVCQNLIQVFSSIPSHPTMLVVCGSEATATPTCRAVSALGGSLVSTTPIPASLGIVSAKPSLFQYGDIINDTVTAATFFSVTTYLYSSQANQYSISVTYYNFTFTNNSLSGATQAFQLKSGWINAPAAVVGVYKGNYPPRTFVDPLLYGAVITPDEHLFYFLFFREYDSTTNTIVNRVGRLCQNDIGITISPEVKVARSFLKATITCKVPSLPSLYSYNYIQSAAANGKGRYFVNGDWAEFVYASFSNFHGTEYNNSVICLYRADNSKNDVTDSGGLNGGVFDTFRSVFSDNTPNGNIECTNLNTDTTHVELRDTITQVTANPLALFTGYVVTAIAVDQTCVVTPDRVSCVNQDVLFLGTSLGKVIKMAMVMDSSGNVTSVTSEEIMLNEVAPVRNLSVQAVNGVKYLYINTDSNIYRRPVQRCSTYSSCRTCVASRDPYCMWNVSSSQCVVSPLVPSVPSDPIPVPADIFQNIHTGFSASCPVWKSCAFTSVGAYYYSPLGACVTCQFVQRVTLNISGDTAKSIPVTLQPSPYNSMEFSGCSSIEASGLQVYTLSLLDDTGALQDTASIRLPEGSPTPLSSYDYIVDQVQSTSFRITMVISQYGRKFDTYYYQVLYNSSSISTQVTTSNSILTKPQVVLQGFHPGDIVTYQIIVSNGYPAPPIYSALNTVTLISGIPGPVVNLTVLSVSDVGVVLVWAPPPATSVGSIIGYSIRMNGVQVTQCALSGQFLNYTATDLVPASTYTFAVSACTSSGEGPAANVTTTTRCTSPAEVQNFMFSNTLSGLNYTWEPPVGNYDSLQYQVDTVCYNSQVSTTSLLLPPLVPLTGNLTLLDPSVTCCVSVYAIANCSLTYGNDLPLTGAQATFCQQTSDVVPLPIRNLSSTPLSPTSALVQWDTSLNYLSAGSPSTISYIVTVTAENVSSVTTTMLPRLHLASLNIFTTYSVSVVGFTPAGSGPAVTMSFSTTGLTPPPPPSNLTLQFVGRSANNLTVSVTWRDPNSAQYNVTSYAIQFHCNDVIYNESVVTTLVATFPVSQSPYIWCSATVQGINSVGRSLLSELVENYYPQYPPSTPGCSEALNLGSELDFEFDVTDALTLTNKTVLTRLTVADVNEYMGVAEANGVRFIMLGRNLTYQFQAVICNRVGCSSPCVLSGTTHMYPPDPPNQVNMSDVTSTTAKITWNYPSRENPSSTKFNAIVTRMGTTVQSLSNLTTTSLQLDSLLPGVLYTVSIETVDAYVGVVSSYQANISFSTLPKGASEPRGLAAIYNQSSLTVLFTEPVTYSGTPLSYQLLWFPQGLLDNCSVDANSSRNTTVPVNSTLSSNGLISIGLSGLDLVNVQNQSVTICVRLCTAISGEVTDGSWAFIGVEKFNTEGLMVSTSSTDVTSVVIAVLVCAVADFILMLASITAVVINKKCKKT